MYNLRAIQKARHSPNMKGQWQKSWIECNLEMGAILINYRMIDIQPTDLIDSVRKTLREEVKHNFYHAKYCEKMDIFMIFFIENRIGSVDNDGIQLSRLPLLARFLYLVNHTLLRNSHEWRKWSVNCCQLNNVSPEKSKDILFLGKRKCNKT